ncbi:hypothetical protein DSAG12_03457 [Promethearchaeum syntrophicum]|uniref:Uncharacterized protein n=1 Tax=Promethearchaeum syntrophicum TaxID=2594042 RepID=A0A5B9DFR0_9ARCH|nr:hypothetical protein [Candidatus Prometheoarchaeum syntrophicum]QEE17620.1 hypothetical protein DSAG12_03457 [Candidatus Prometheoarchaeum syntrophicum]
MNNFNESIRLSLKVVDIDINEKLIKGGSEIDMDAAIALAFPKSNKTSMFGFKKIGDDLRIRKLPHF